MVIRSSMSGMDTGYDTVNSSRTTRKSLPSGQLLSHRFLHIAQALSTLSTLNGASYGYSPQ